MTTPFQPTLPVPGVMTEQELNFLDESPPGLFAENQDSNIGLKRKVFSDKTNEVADQIALLYAERFIPSASQFLDQWEEEVGLPVNPSGLTIAQRRSRIASRLQTGPFTTDRVSAIVEAYILATLGDAVHLDAGGAILDASGLPLFSDATVIAGLYAVYWNPRTFSYEVWIKNTATVDAAALTRELQVITPSGYSFTIDNTKTNVLNYFRQIRGIQPLQYYQLDNDATDSSGNAIGGAFVGTPTNVASLVSAAAGGGSAMNFNGTTQYMTIAHTAQMDQGDKFSIEFWIKPTNFTGNPRIITRGALSWEVYFDSAGALRLQVPNTATIVVHSSILLAAGSTYHVVVEKNGTLAKIFVNGVDVSVVDNPGVVFVDNSAQMVVARSDSGASNFFNGVLDDIAIHDRILTPAQVLRNYMTGTNTP